MFVRVIKAKITVGGRSASALILVSSIILLMPYILQIKGKAKNSVASHSCVTGRECGQSDV